MAKFCTHCGAQLADDDLICSQCGAIQESTMSEQPEAAPASVTKQSEAASTSAPEIPQTPVGGRKPRKTAKWWMIGIPVMAAVLIAVVCFWNSAAEKDPPRSTLSAAVSKTEERLADQMDGSPMQLLLQWPEIMKNGTVHMDVNSSFMGNNLSSQFCFQSNVAKRQWTASAAIDANAVRHDINFYIDSNVAAVSSSDYMNGRYYGLTYSTLSEDLLSAAAGHLTAEQIERLSKISDGISEQINSDQEIATAFKPYLEMLRAYFEGIEPIEEKGSITFDGTEYACDTFTFKIDKEKSDKLCIDILDKMEKDADLKGIFTKINAVWQSSHAEPARTWEETIQSLREDLKEHLQETTYEGDLVFYVYDGALADVVMNFSGAGEGHTFKEQAELNFGPKPGISDIKVTYRREIDDEVFEYKYKVSTQKDGDNYKRTITFNSKDPLKSRNFEIVSSWNRSSGKLSVNFFSENVKVAGVSMNLTEVENGFRISIDFGQNDIPYIFGGMTAAEPSFELNFSMDITCTKGCEITTPEFVNLDQWEEDLWAELQKIFPNTPVLPTA